MKTSFLFIVIIMLGFFPSAHAQKQFKALIVTNTNGWHHESIHYGVVALKELATRNFFDAEVFQDPESFNDSFLKQFQVIIFLNTTGDIFNAEQQKVMERFIQSGKGFVGVHSASDTEYDWDWYNKLVGRMFYIHPVIQTAKLQILDNSFPGMQGFGQGNLWTDEWYQFGEEKVKDLHYILGVDETTYNPKADWGAKKGEGMGKSHPLAWYHNYDGGRSFYTALGHLPTNFSNEAFLNHLYAGILWAATGKK
ncbi:MAG TPA: ThuA domain-containing protein [Flavisolibacter sp.]|jgi:type 1 glutamine amidotransferase|nr:ThuA domain-containing protein [Flavisolibacter sp.]